MRRGLGATAGNLKLKLPCVVLSTLLRLSLSSFLLGGMESAPTKPETVEAYKARLRSIALKLPKRVVKTAVEAIPKRAKAIVAASGGCIARD